MAELTDENLQGSRFLRVDLSGARLHGVVLQNVKITLDEVDVDILVSAAR